MPTLSEYLVQERSVFNSTWRLFQPEVKAFDLLDLTNKAVTKSINAGLALDADVAHFMMQLWHVVHSYLRVSFLIVLRGKTQEAFAPLRTAIEMTAHLGTVGLSPAENSTIWFNQNKKPYKGKYKRIFEGSFPERIQGMANLEKAYYHCCDIGSHAGHRQLAGRSGVDENTGEYVLYSLNADGDSTCGALVYILNVVMDCLYVFHFCFRQTLTKEGFAPVNKTVKFSVEEIKRTISLRQKQRQEFLKREKR